MKSLWTSAALFIALGICAVNSHAALINGSTLLIGDNSYFELEGFGQTPVTGVDSIVLGTAQPYDFSHGGSRIDQFIFLGTTGMHYTTGATNVLNSSDNTATVDFSNWSWAFNYAAATFDLGSGAWGANPDGVAKITCGNTCENGDSFTLYYTATVPEDEPHGYAGFAYELHLYGTVSAVPVPAAIWLFVSGLMGLACTSVRKRNQGRNSA